VIWVAAYGFFDGAVRRGLGPRACDQLHSLLDAVHNIPAELAESSNPCCIVPRLRTALTQYDLEWGPRSAFAQRHSEHFIRPVSVLAIYDAALASNC
jgi:hypothetical protein